MFVSTVTIAVTDVVAMPGTIMSPLEPGVAINVLVDYSLVRGARTWCAGGRCCGRRGCNGVLQFSEFLLESISSVPFLHD